MNERLEFQRFCTQSLQGQVREMLIGAILAGKLKAGDPVPSTRSMATKLKVSRNTVAFAYQALVNSGFLIAKDRRGYFVAATLLRDRLVAEPDETAVPAAGAPDWGRKIHSAKASTRSVFRPADWHSYPYPFVYGQQDLSLFPLSAWRDCVRQAMSKQWYNAWTDDLYLADDPLLIEQIRTKVLTQRGIFAQSEEILVTLGSQNAFYLLASALVRAGTPVAMEDPGYYAARDVLARAEAALHPVAVDGEGLDPDRLPAADLLFTTPSHQFPTNVTLSLERRYRLLAWAEQTDALIIEDDYEAEINFSGAATMPMKALDRCSRVIYVGSFSKSLMPGLRLGFVVAEAPLIAELRRLRGLMMRHPPSNNQRTVALFLALGHHDAYLSRIRRVYTDRWSALSAALERHFPGWVGDTKYGGSSFWLRADTTCPARDLAEKALAVGVVIEPGEALFHNAADGGQFFRLGFSSIPEDKIAAGVERLRAVVDRLR
ncbi:PLP-dependent aminotransferase family protein [uncultured Nitratireductor sp.]|uniref:MocR-like pyridoxine biosynthesis transcription factor PdxR n=1 Tax=uncultured Nitratireductor sp. TaxID=520953 RepID=UPI00263875FE|nr:PLP-dependent aminotransferase family protein [uncultured Nitratireductor sp.]